jgi:pimeloyl-ACP methyl ester carboxylesterase
LRVVGSLAAAALAAIVLGRLAVEARRYARAAAARAARRSDCPFEDDDDTPRPFLQEAFDVVQETLASARLALRGAVGLRAADPLAPGPSSAGPLVVLLPERGYGAGSLAPLGRRIADAIGGRTALEPHTRDRSVEGRAARVADFLDALAACPAPADVVLLGHGEGGLVACEAVTRRGRARVTHVVTIGSAHDTTQPSPASLRTTLLSVYSLHDARLVPPARAYLPGELNIVVRDVGHCGLVLAARTAALVVEALGDPPASAASDAS